MSYPRIRQAYTDWLATSPDPKTDAAFLAWMAELLSVNRASFSGDELFQQTEATEFAGLSVEAKQLWVSFTSRSIVDPWAANNVAFVRGIFGDTAQTVLNLAEARVVQQPRHQATYGIPMPGQSHLDRLRIRGEIN